MPRRTARGIGRPFDVIRVNSLRLRRTLLSAEKGADVLLPLGWVTCYRNADGKACIIVM